MSKDDVTDIAALYVLGTLTSDERHRFERELASDAALQTRVEQWESALSPLSDDDPQTVTPSADLWSRIEGAITRTVPGTLTVRAEDGEWETVRPGVHKKMLMVEHDTGFECFLLRMDPGAEVPAHGHRATEECLVMEGDLRVGAMVLNSGDFHVVPSGTPHEALHSRGGALLYLRCQPTALAPASA